MDQKILKELENIKKQVKDFEDKYLFSNNNLIITAILSQLTVAYLENGSLLRNGANYDN